MRISDWSSDVCSSDLLRQRKTETSGTRISGCPRCWSYPWASSAGSRPAKALPPPAHHSRFPDSHGRQQRATANRRSSHRCCLPRSASRKDRASFHHHSPEPHKDRKSVVSGKSVSVRVDLGGSRTIKKKT